MASIQIVDDQPQLHGFVHGDVINTFTADASLKPLEKVAIEVSPLSNPDSGSDTSASDDGQASTSTEEAHHLSATTVASYAGPATSSASGKAQHFIVAARILNIIESYGVHSKGGDGTWEAFDKFLPIVAKQVAQRETVRVLLPAFPFKSPNTEDIVLGTLPDLGEELALAHLNGLANKIALIYEPGAQIEICSDGLVYNEFQGVSDDTAWEYGEALRDIAVTNRLNNISFIRIWDLLDYPRRQYEDRAKAKAFYLEHALYLRRELDYRYGVKNFDIDYAIAHDPDIAFTYESYIDFLHKELPEREDGQSVPADLVAKGMLARGKAYAAILNAVRPNSVRLSIHNSIGKGKLSVPLIPQGQDSVGLMPWRSVVAIDADGSCRTVYPADVRDTHDLIYRHGRPYAYRIKSNTFDWKADGLDMKVARLCPGDSYARRSSIDAC